MSDEISILYLNSHSAATWAYLLADEQQLRNALVELDTLEERFSRTNRQIVTDALAKRFPPAPNAREDA